MWLHWDGNNNQVEERNKSAAIGAGATEDSLDLASLDRVAQWALDLKPPAFPPAHIDRTQGRTRRADLSDRVRPLSRPGWRGGRTGDAAAEIGTDPERLQLVHRARSWRR